MSETMAVGHATRGGREAAALRFGAVALAARSDARQRSMVRHPHCSEHPQGHCSPSPPVSGNSPRMASSFKALVYTSST